MLPDRNAFGTDAACGLVQSCKHAGQAPSFNAVCAAFSTAGVESGSVRLPQLPGADVMQVQLETTLSGRRPCRIHALAAALAYCCVVVSAQAVEAPAKRIVEFRSGFFPGSSRVDLSQFNEGNVVLPGVYPAAVQVNGEPAGPESLTFQAPAPGQSAQLCVDRLMLERFGVDMERVDADAAAAGQAAGTDVVDGCRSLEQWVPGASGRFDQGEQTLLVQIPQLYLSRRPRGFVSAAQLDSGVTAGLLHYNANLYESRIGDSSDTRGYLGLRAGFNAGGWLLRHQGSVSWDGKGGSQYQSGSTYAQRDIVALQSQLVLGQLYSSGDLFGSVRLRGIELATDDRMLPQSMVGYAPVVTGTAESNALVRVMQRGVVLRELTVAPGPFQVDDLNAVGYGGDLEVVVREADGREKTFTVPFSGAARLLRPGYSRYALSAGQVDSEQYGYRPYLLQAQLQRGMSNAVTGYAGVLKSEHYGAAQIGASLNTPVGALSLDLTQARLQLPDQHMQGHSLQLRYSKQLPQIGTSFVVGAYRYSTEGYLDINQALRLRAEAEEVGTPRSVDRYRSRFEATIRQSLGDSGGQLYATAYSQDYWNRGGRALSYSVGYNNRWKSLGYGLMAQRSTSVASQRSDNEFSMTLTVPLGGSDRAPNLYSTVRRDREGDAGVNLGLSGSTGRNRQLQYGVNAMRAKGESSFGASVGYQAPWAILGGSYSQGASQRSASFDLSGGVLVHAGGVTLAPNLGDTIGLIHAPDATGARVGDGDGARIDARGYALIPALTPYRFNTVELDPYGMSSDVVLKTTTRVVAPRYGAVVWLDYPTDSGRSVLIKARRADGRPLPFAASVLDAYGNSVGNVGQGSRVQLRSDDTQGLLTVRWGRQGDEQCQIAYQLPESTGKRQQTPDVIEQAVCENGPRLASKVPGQRVSAAPAAPAAQPSSTERRGSAHPRGRNAARPLPSLDIPGALP